MLIDFCPRPDYGRSVPSIRIGGKLGWRINVGKNLLTLRSEVELTSGKNHGLSGELRLRRGEFFAFSLTFSEEAPAVLPPLGKLVDEKLKLPVDSWQRWAARAEYDGPYRKDVIRSALVLALLSFCSLWRLGCRADDFVAGTNRRRIELGLSLLLVARCCAGRARAD